MNARRRAITPATFGVYFDGLFALGGQEPYEHGFGIAGRFLFSPVASSI